MTTLKSKFLIIALGLALAGGSSAAPELDARKTMAITTNPLFLLRGDLPLTFRFGVSDRVSMGIGVVGNFFALSQGIKRLGVGGTLDAKFNLSSQVFTDSWYIKPAVTFGYQSLKVGPLKSNGYYLMPSAIFGYDWVWDSGFTMGLGLGIGYNHSFTDLSKIDSLPFGSTGIMPTGELTLGFAF